MQASKHRFNPLRQEFVLSDRFSVDMVVSTRGISCAWSPHVPDKLTPEELAAYRQARSEIVRRLSAQLGFAIAVIEA